MKSILKFSIIVVIVLTFSYCSSDVFSKNSKEKIPTSKEIVTTLCSDKFQGRLTGSDGNEKAGEYIAKTFKDIGLDYYVADSYYEKYQVVISNFGGGGIASKVETVNVIGVIKGKDSKKAVVISAHYDHLGYVDGKIFRGALDNASGVSALIKIAHTLKEKSKDKPFKMDIIFCAFNGEEELLSGSRTFVNELKAKSMYNGLYNINIDCIGAKEGETNLALNNISKISGKLYDAVKATLKKDNIGFKDITVRGGSDYMSFEDANIPNIFFVQENIEKLVHKPSDTPDILDYEQIDKIANAISDFVETNDGIMFN